MRKTRIIIISDNISKEYLTNFFDYPIWTLDYSPTSFKVNNTDVCHKLWLLFSQLYMREWIFVNTVFPLLRKLKKYDNALYSKLVPRVSAFLHLYRKDIHILLHKPNACEKEIMLSMNVRYTEFKTKAKLKTYIFKITKWFHH